MPHDAGALGVEGTVDVIRGVVAKRLGIAGAQAEIPADRPLFSVGVGLSSIEGMELLVELEREFGVEIKDVDWWIYDSPTLTNVAEYLIELSRKQNRRA